MRFIQRTFHITEIRSNDAGLVSDLKDVIKHIIVYLTSYPWKQSRILCNSCSLKGATNSFMTGSAGVRYQSLIAFFQSVDALVHYTPHPQ
jgi:hypothetical protein